MKLKVLPELINVMILYVFPSANIAAGACSGNGILFDITDPYNPKRMDVVSDTGFAYWHSATLAMMLQKLFLQMNGEVR